MPTIQFSNGKTVQFSAMPTQQEIEQLGQQMGIHQPEPSAPPQQKPFAPGGSQFEQPTPAGATQMNYKNDPGTSTASKFMGSLGQGAKQTAQSLTAPIVGGAKEFANDTSQAFQGGLQQGREGIAQFSHSSGNPMDLISGVGKLGSGFVQSAFSPLAAAFKPVSNAMNFVADKASNSQGVQNFANSQVGQTIGHIAGDVANYANIAGAVGGAMEAPKIASTGAKGVNAIGEAAKPGMRAVGQDIVTGAKAVSDIPGKAAQGLENRYVKQAQTEWTKPTTKPSGFNKATEIFNKAKTQGHDISQTLVNNKLKLSDHVQEGKFATADTATKIRTDAIKASNEILRPSLEKADLTTPKTPVTDVLKAAQDSIKNNKSLVSETKANLLAKLKQTQASLEKQYPNGMSLTDLHNEKIVRDLNSKYSPVGDIATNTEAIKNKAMADAARTTLEKNAPKDIPVKQFNAELAKQHQAANYLDALNGKKAPVTIGTKIARGAAKVAGASVGHTLGGGILGIVGGYHIGGMVESMFENMSNPVKNSFLKNLEVTNPEAFTQVQEYLNRPAPQLATPNIGLSIKDVSKAKPATLKYLGKEKTTPESMVRINDYKNPYPKIIKPKK